MWLLSCEGDLFAGKRIWLRPGTSHLLGRTAGKSEAEQGVRLRHIDHKSVSRKHLTIKIGAVKAGDSSRLHARSELTFTDGSKVGTTINGGKLVQDSQTLNAKEYTIKLANYEHVFHVWWHPVTLSFTSLSKKSGKDVLATWRERLEQTDVKLVTEYIANETTHAIAKKRNTPAALQTLLQGRWVVTDGFAEALAAAVAKRGTEPSVLEDDFETSWPKEEDYIVPSGNEPHPRQNEYLKPNPSRTDLFQGLVFIFMSQAQHDTLLSVVTTGGGKAVVKDVDFEQTSVQDFMVFVKEAAGRKKSDRTRFSQDPDKGGIVIVRPNEKSDEFQELMRNVDLEVGQRSIEQNEFLDAIVTADASSLRKPIEEEPSSSFADSNAAGSSRASNSRQQNQQAEQQRQRRAVTVPDSPTPAPREPPRTQPQPEEQEPAEQPSAARRRNRRIVTQSRFKGFDDFDPSQFSKPGSQSPEPSASNREASAAPADHNMDVDDSTPQPSQSKSASRKRPAPVEEQQDEEDFYGSILQGHAAMKRQKTLAGEKGKNISYSKAAEQIASEKKAKAKKKAKELDVKAEIQARREREEEERRRDEESLREAMDGVDISELKNLAKVEEMEVQVRQAPSRGNNCGRSERWDPAWNGRKNFKKFRPKGQRGETGRTLQRVIVSLEEVPRKGHGIGEEYCVNSCTRRSNKSKSQSQSQSQSVRQGASRSQTANAEGGDDNTSFRRRIQRSREEDQENSQMDDILPEEIAGQPRDEEIAALANANSSPSQTMRSESQRKTSGKRPAAQAAAGAPATKKAKSRPATRNEPINLGDDDDDDDDGLKFRRRRR